MKAKIVVGLGFGDEGKGITTDYLVSKHPSSIVVRYCGGHQAGHTVVKDGIQHIFSSYCSGALRGAESYISEHCCFYPPNLIREKEILQAKILDSPKLTVHPLAKLTTPYDIAYNQLLEMRLKHGSVGVGIGTTMKRNEGVYKLHAVDLLNKRVLKAKLERIEAHYESELWGWDAKAVKHYKDTTALELKFFWNSISSMSGYIAPYDYLRNFRHVIFEGAQGILLDMDFGIFPNVTFGHTSSRNAISICEELGITDIDVYYVTRCYTTRHGNGWIPDEEGMDLMNNESETNKTNDWQGSFRVCELDYDLLAYAMDCDNAYSYDCDKHLVVTCLDQRPGYEFTTEKLGGKTFYSVTGSYSNDSKDFKTLKSI